MNSRQRLQAAISFNQPDRVPFDLGSSDVTGIHWQAYAALCTALGLDEPVEIIDPLQGLARVSDAVRDALQIDTAGIWLNPSLTPLSADLLKDEWGVAWRKPEHGLWYEPCAHPLRTASRADLRTHPWPNPADPARFSGEAPQKGVAETAARLAEDGRYGLVANFSGALLARGQLLRGPAEFLADLLGDPELAGELLDRILEINLALVENFLTLVGDRIDVIKVSDDLGSQANLLISPTLYRRMIKPRQAQFFTRIHQLTSARILYHTCGSVARLVDDFIEIGVDILNPIQASAQGMQTEALGQKYAGRLVFWGAVDNQGILSLNQPERVPAEAARRIAHLARPAGGYVLASSHNLQPNTQPAVILALSQAARTLETPA